MSTNLDTDAVNLVMLEEMIDKNGLANLLGLVVDICREKSEHVKVNWPDNIRAELWIDAAQTIEDSTLELNV